ncbi:TlyA family RNA methyltransferase [Microbacterium sp. BK668]|uniref:TlyA family RNA methyltransferase n=1 Tax=Microbacterium sp. BK668 TaxID=2512118 RepID=UPI00105FB349|nr:TlyA family RNA methyltransferase [Microbacterium sp. BK668]TDN93271.1 23S rRNA (cytidine1920-2'-O)/16S rRNA (cytidine1409-2'-O)-methyltransferase [Microbacterium sp. BK668]
MSRRLDAALAERGLARSRTHAAALIAEGLVSVDGRTVVKASTPVAEHAELAVAGADHYVSRAAHKLLAALDAFDLDPRGRVALDMGASTGGFTQVLRERGADPVIAVDVGHGQLAGIVREDAGVVGVEGFNVRFMTRESLAQASGVPQAPSLVTGDLSFISLTLVLPAAAGVCAAGGDLVLLIKPQFEVGRTAVKGGLVTDPGSRIDAVERVLWAAWDCGLGTLGIISSPIVGTHGNREYVAHLAPGRGANPTEWLSTVNRLAGAR